MKKISLNNIILFRQKSDKGRQTLLNNLKREGEAKSDGSGGNYWVRSLSALSNGFKLKDTQPIKEKISEILELFTPSLIKQTKDMYERNLSILHNYEDFDFSNWLPENSEILTKTNKKSIIYINTIPVQITPSQIYSFEKEGKQCVGAVWFIAKLEGYKTEELGMFVEALYIYLSSNFDEKFEISPENCLVVDVLSKKEINYQMLVDEDVPSIFSNTLELIKMTL
ncbi:hypothetical protein [Chryseobacterium proteolyticum]|uniref:hypothetical protein n=1 Tax=Chryseobacterium proteolyticum TaxID=118127 RepID=UPI0039839BF3